MAAKYDINLNQVINNFKAAEAAYSGDALSALFYGDEAAKRVTAVFFVPRTAAAVGDACERLAAAVAPGTVFLGADDAAGATNLRRAVVAAKWTAAQLRTMSAAKLATRLTGVKHTETLSVPVGDVFVRIALDIAINPNADMEWLTKRLAEVRGLLRVCELAGTDNSGNSISILADANTCSLKALIPPAKKGAAISNIDERFPLNMSFVLCVGQELSDCNLHKQICAQADGVLDQALRLYKKNNGAVKLNSYTLRLPSTSSLVNVVLPTDPSDEDKAEFAALLNLPAASPLFAPSRALQLQARPVDGRLLNPHEFVKTTPNGQVAIVTGSLHYHHYMQDAFDDSGWGCAYRSFQSVCSWLQLQGFMDKPVPTHRDIQQCLVDIGDKKATFVGSKQWIGSMELSFCLETMFGIASRVLTTNSGAEVADHARSLLFHFDAGGGPVMIGGGQLAHTILGVDYNTRSGECKYLILDPHYTGDENIEHAIAGGWCAWKGGDFWRKADFYNLLLPLTAPLSA